MSNFIAKSAVDNPAEADLAGERAALAPA